MFETGKVDVTIHASTFKLVREILFVNPVLIDESYEDGKVIMPI